MIAELSLGLAQQRNHGCLLGIRARCRGASSCRLMGLARWALAGRASFDFLDSLVVWHAGILSSVVDGILGRLTTEAPQWHIAGGAGSRAVKTRASSTVTLWSQPKSSPFCDNLVAMIEPQRSWSDQGTGALCRLLRYAFVEGVQPARQRNRGVYWSRS